MDANARRALIADMHQRTERLAADAGKLGDGFLQYLYGLPLACLEQEDALPEQPRAKAKVSA